VQVRDGNTSRKDREVRMLRGIVGSSLGSKLIQLSGSDTWVNTLNHLLGNSHGVNELGVLQGCVFGLGTGVGGVWGRGERGGLG